MNQFTFLPAGHKDSFSPHPYQHLLIVVFWITAILTGARWWLFMVLTCISLMIKDVECLFRRLLAIFMSFWKKCLFRFSAYFSYLGFCCSLFVFFFFFYVELYAIFLYLQHSLLISYNCSKYLHPFSRQPFCLVDNFNWVKPFSLI